MMLKHKILNWLFGMKLPCCKGRRFRRKLGSRVKCIDCGRMYRKVFFIKTERKTDVY